MKNIYYNSYLNLILQWNQVIILQNKRNDYILLLRKLNLTQQQLNRLVQYIIGFKNKKKQLMAIKWLKNGSIKLPDQSQQKKLNQAAELSQKYHVDYQKFNSPQELIDNTISNLSEKSRAEHQKINLDKIPEFSHRVQHGNGIVTYWVQDSKQGQLAVRKVIDIYWGYDANPWCLTARKDGWIRHHATEIQQMTQQQKVKIGLYDPDQLSIAWNAWNTYNTYQKRIAFKNGQLYAFSANSSEQVIWWDRDNQSFKYFPKDHNIKDKDIEFYKQLKEKEKYINHITNDQLTLQQINQIINSKNEYYMKKLLDNNKINISENILEQLYQNGTQNIKYLIAKREDLTQNLISKLATSQSTRVKACIAERPKLSQNIILKLINDQQIKYVIMRREDLSQNLIIKLANNHSSFTRNMIARRTDLSQDLIRKLANDQSASVRNTIAKKIDLSQDLIRKLANDQNASVRGNIAQRTDLPQDLIIKLVNDQSTSVRNIIAERTNLSQNLIIKLANDPTELVRITIACREDLSQNVKSKLASDKSITVRKLITQIK